MKYLTKSKFKIALECPTKLFYTENLSTYANNKLDDPFLEALAKGGFQVGELAKCYYPNGSDIKELDKKVSEEKTNELLKKEKVVIFEAAIQYKGLFIRVDILEKIGNTINLIEVKSKSANPRYFHDELWNARLLKRGIHSLKSIWKPYIYDVAFQAFVLKKAFPNYQVNSFLMCADKTAIATVNGLNQKFLLQNKNGRTNVKTIGDISLKALGARILRKLPLTDIVDIIHQEKEAGERFNGKGFEEAIWLFADSLNKGEKLASEVDIKCKSCEFRCHQPEKKCGFDECWNEEEKVCKKDLQKPFVFDIWNFSLLTAV